MVSGECYHLRPQTADRPDPRPPATTADTTVNTHCRQSALTTLVVFGMACLTSVAVAQLDRSERESVETAPLAETNRIYTVETAPEIDGTLEEIWQAGTPLKGPFRQVNPDEGEPGTERTEVYLMRDSKNFYVGIRCWDSEPSGIVASQMRYDGDFAPDDNVTIVIDPFRDRRTGYVFRMTAGGARKDGRITNGDRVDFNWDGIWYGRAAVDDEGWTAEMVIPFQTILADPDIGDWGINAERFIRRKNETVRWATPRREIRISSVANADVIGGFVDLDIGSGVDLKPFIRADIRDDGQNQTDVATTAGLDLFWKIDPSLTLAITVNNDFAETEVDQRQINFGRFPLFFPEKRDFFLEDAGFFNFGGIRRNPLPFYSRRIGIAPDGAEQGILAGARLTGKIEDLNVGLMNVQMKSNGFSKNYSVARVFADVLDESTVGAIMTAGDPEDGESNIVGGVDFNYKNTNFGTENTLTGNAFALVSDSSDRSGDSTAFGFKLGYPNDVVGWFAGFSRIGDAYNAALGFNPRVGIYEYYGGWRYRWRPDDGFIRSVDTGFNAFLVTDLQSDVESFDFKFEALEIKTEDGTSINLNYLREREVPLSSFTVADAVTIAPGDYTWNGYEASFESSDGNPFTVNGEIGWSGYYGGTRFEWGGGALWRISPQFVVGGDFEYNDIEVQDQRVITRQLTAIADIYFTPDISLQNYVQWDDVSNTVGINSRFRWSPEPGTDLYIVFNQNVESEDLEFTLTKSELITKFGWTIRF